MITKIALTAWKRLFPYLSEGSQQAIAKNIRKPLTEYNKGVAEGSKNIANRLGVDIIGADGKSQVADFLTHQYGGARAAAGGKRVLNSIANEVYTPEVRAATRLEAERLGYGTKDTDAFFNELDTLVNKYSTRKDSVPIAVVRRSRGTAKDEFTRNALLRHELSENKHTLRYYTISPDGLIKTPRKKVELTRPTYNGATAEERAANPNGVNSHASLNVIADELKDALKSGRTDLFTRADLDKSGWVKDSGFLGLLAGRYGTGELSQLLRAGKDRLFTTPNRYKHSLRNGVVKRDQKRFFKNIEKAQNAQNIPNRNNTSSELDAPGPTYLWPERKEKIILPQVKYKP